MISTLTLLSALSSSAIAASSLSSAGSTASSSSISPIATAASSASSLATSILFSAFGPPATHGASVTYEASIISVAENGTTMEISCPTQDIPHDINPASPSSSSFSTTLSTTTTSSLSAAGCPLTNINPTLTALTITEGPIGPSGTTLAFAYPTGYGSSIDGVFASAGGAYGASCIFPNSLSGNCTHSPFVPGLDVDSTTVTPHFSTATMQLGAADITMLPIVVTAGAEKLSASASSTSTGSAVPSPSQPGQASGLRVGMGLIGGVVAAFVGYGVFV